MNLLEKLCKELGVEVGEEWLGNDGKVYIQRLNEKGIHSNDIITIKINKDDLDKLDISKEHLTDVLYYARILDSKGYVYDLEYNQLKRVSLIIKNNSAIAGYIAIGEGTDWIKDIRLMDKSLTNKFDALDLWFADDGDIKIIGDLPDFNTLKSIKNEGYRRATNNRYEYENKR